MEAIGRQPEPAPEATALAFLRAVTVADLFDLVDPNGPVDKSVLLAANGGHDRRSLVMDHQFRLLFACLKTPTAPLSGTVMLPASSRAAAACTQGQTGGGQQ